MDTFDSTPFDGVYDSRHEFSLDLAEELYEENPMQPKDAVRGFALQDMSVRQSASMESVVELIKDAVQHPNCTLSKFAITLPTIVTSAVQDTDEETGDVSSGTFKVAFVIADDSIGESITIEMDVEVVDGVMVKLPKKAYVEELAKNIKLKPDNIRKAIMQTKLNYQ